MKNNIYKQRIIEQLDVIDDRLLKQIHEIVFQDEVVVPKDIHKGDYLEYIDFYGNFITGTVSVVSDRDIHVDTGDDIDAFDVQLDKLLKHVPFHRVSRWCSTNDYTVEKLEKFLQGKTIEVTEFMDDDCRDSVDCSDTLLRTEKLYSLDKCDSELYLWIPQIMEYRKYFRIVD